MEGRTYEELLAEALPQVIQTEKQHREIGRRFGALIGKARARTPVETRLMRLLAVLIEDYDRRHALPPDEATPSERLRFPDPALRQNARRLAARVWPAQPCK
ncbi:MAG: hypothetical protein ABSH50_03710 [Bryobacteraceae bacterium]|jgi:hypothetical protein